MTKPIDLDQYRGLAAQNATDARRLAAREDSNEQARRAKRDELERRLVTVPAANWKEAAEKARYIFGLYAANLGENDTRSRHLIDAASADFDRLEEQ